MLVGEEVQEEEEGEKDFLLLLVAVVFIWEMVRKGGVSRQQSHNNQGANLGFKMVMMMIRKSTTSK